MFTELMPLLRKRGLLLTISIVKGDTTRATIVPQKASDTEDNALTTPIGNLEPVWLAQFTSTLKRRMRESTLATKCVCLWTSPTPSGM